MVPAAQVVLANLVDQEVPVGQVELESPVVPVVLVAQVEPENRVGLVVPASQAVRTSVRPAALAARVRMQSQPVSRAVVALIRLAARTWEVRAALALKAAAP